MIFFRNDVFVFVIVLVFSEQICNIVKINLTSGLSLINDYTSTVYRNDCDHRNVGENGSSTVFNVINNLYDRNIV